MNKPKKAQSREFGELASALDQLIARLPALTDLELIALWPGLERRVLALVLADDGSDAAGLAHPEQQRVRNLVWEIGVSVDLQAMHVRALETLARLLRARAEPVEVSRKPLRVRLGSDARPVQ